MNPGDQIFDLDHWLEGKTVESISLENYLTLTRILSDAGWFYSGTTKTWSRGEHKELPIMDAARVEAKAMKLKHLEKEMRK